MSGNSFDCFGGVVEEVAALFSPHAPGPLGRMLEHCCNNATIDQRFLGSAV